MPATKAAGHIHDRRRGPADAQPSNAREMMIFITSLVPA